MATYDYTNVSKFSSFIEHLSQDQREQFLALVIAGQTIVKASPQDLLDAADTVACTVATALVMH